MSPEEQTIECTIRKEAIYKSKKITETPGIASTIKQVILETSISKITPVLALFQKMYPSTKQKPFVEKLFRLQIRAWITLTIHTALVYPLVLQFH